jgi:hypothetical protein
MKGVELYGQERLAVYVEGLSRREAARRFGLRPHDHEHAQHRDENNQRDAKYQIVPSLPVLSVLSLVFVFHQGITTEIGAEP